MPVWVWVLIAVAVIAALALLVWQTLARRRTGKLRGQFGPEYDRVVDAAEHKRDAEGELAARQERRQQLEIRPLRPEAAEGYRESWQTIQAQFVDSPEAAVT